MTTEQLLVLLDKMVSELGDGYEGETIGLAVAKIREQAAELAKREVMVWVPMPVLDALTVDQHHWSSRPCSTCKSITVAIGKPFGCNAETIKEEDRRKRREAQEQTMNIEPTPEHIWLICDDEFNWSWCDSPDPSEGIDEDDTVEYVRADCIKEPEADLARARALFRVAGKDDSSEFQDWLTGRKVLVDVEDAKLITLTPRLSAPIEVWQEFNAACDRVRKVVAAAQE